MQSCESVSNCQHHTVVELKNKERHNMLLTNIFVTHGNQQFQMTFEMSLPYKSGLAVAQTNHKPLQHCFHDAKAHSVAQRPHDVRLFHHCEIQLFPNLRWPSHEFPRFRQAQPSSRSLLAVAAPHKQPLLPCPFLVMHGQRLG